MKKTSLILAALFAAAWAAAPLAVSARGDDDDCEDCDKGGPAAGDRGGDRAGDRGPDRDDRGGDRGERGGDRGERGGWGGGGRGPREGGPGGRMGMGGPGGDPEMRQRMETVHGLEKKLRELHDKISRSADSDKTAAKAEARKLIGELFDAKLAMETAMAAKMEKHLAELKEKIAKKKAGREKMIDSKLSRVMGENDDWD
jgi:hypothetical protein